MLKDLLSVLPKGNPRFLGSFLRLRNCVVERMKVAKKKFDLVELPRTPGVETLEWIIHNLNRDVAKTYTDDFELYTSLLEKKADDYKIIFDPVATKSLSKGKFFRGRNGNHPTEVFLNVSHSSPITQLPFGKVGGWEQFQAIKFVYHDSLELPIDFNSGFANFVDRPPSFAVVAIDVPLLLMKWLKFRQKWARGVASQQTALCFLKQEWYMLWDDMVDIWITNVLDLILFHKDAATQKLVNEINLNRFIADKAMVELGVQAVQQLVSLINTRNLKIQDLMDSQFYTRDRSIRDMINHFEDDLLVPESQQYLWLDVAKSIPFFKIITSILDRDPENPVAKQIMLKAYRVYERQLKHTKLPSYQFAGPVREYVELMLSLITGLFEAKITLPTDPNTQA